MYKQILEQITDIEVYPVISLVIFFIFFLLVLGWILTLNKNYINKMKNIPLEDEMTINEKQNINAGGVK